MSVNLGPHPSPTNRASPTPPPRAPPQSATAASHGYLHLPDLYINLANVALARQDYTGAIKLYQVALDKLDDSKMSLVRGG